MKTPVLHPTHIDGLLATCMDLQGQHENPQVVAMLSVLRNLEMDNCSLAMDAADTCTSAEKVYEAGLEAIRAGSLRAARAEIVRMLDGDFSDEIRNRLKREGLNGPGKN